MHVALIILVVTLFFVGLYALATAKALRNARRADFIRGYALPKGLIERLMKRRPELHAKQGQLAARALRQFFLAHLKGDLQFVAMPSQVADDLWHEFILYTRLYELFCQQAFGQFMHHTPAVVLSNNQSDNIGLRRCWWQCCKEENINPSHPTRLPLLFALDEKLGVADGFRYAPDCKALRAADVELQGQAAVHCGGDFSSPSVGGSTEGFGDGGSGGSVGGGDSGSDGGGSGCGGGGGGGGD